MKKYHLHEMKVFATSFRKEVVQGACPVPGKVGSVHFEPYVWTAEFPDIELPKDAQILFIQEDCQALPYVFCRVLYLVPALE